MQCCYARCQSGLAPHQPPARTKVITVEQSSWIKYQTNARATLLRPENKLQLGPNWVGE